MRVITGKARGVSLKTPNGMTTRPTADRVKEALFSIIQFDVPTARVLDLFGGTGQLGIEALSRDAKSAVFVDANREACALIRENLKRTKLESEARVVCSDYASYLRSCNEMYDIIFLDPPYSETFLENSLKLISEIKFLKRFSAFLHSSSVSFDFLNTSPTDATIIKPRIPAEKTLIAFNLYR